MFREFIDGSFSNKVYVMVIVCAVSALCVIGLLMVYSVTSATNIEAGESAFTDALSQLAFCIVGSAIAFGFSKFKRVICESSVFVFAFWGIAFFLVLLVPFFGVEVNGAKRWLNFGFITLQPSELLKIAFILSLVKILSDLKSGQKDWVITLIYIAVFIFLPLGVLYFTQRDMGTTIICVLSLLTVAYIAGVNLFVVGGIFAACVCLGLVAIFLGGDFRSGRLNFINPWDDGEGGYGSGYNVIRSYYAISSGGLFGMGLGNSHEKFDYLYAADNDFIFAVICEELGLLGGFVVIICVLLIFFSSLKLASANTSFESCLVIWGASAVLIVQSFLNIGCAVGALPTTGKPLPFVSSGGSAIISAFILIGLIFNCSLNSESEVKAKRRRDSIKIVSRSSNRSLRQHVSDSNSQASSRDLRSPKRCISSTSRQKRSVSSTKLKDPSFLDKKR